MKITNSKEVNSLVKELESLGFALVSVKRHIKMTYGSGTLVISRSPSDEKHFYKNVMKNARSILSQCA